MQFQSQLTPEGAPAVGGGGMFRVRPEHVPAVIAGFEEAIRELDGINRDALRLQDIGGPGDDQFSAQAAREIARQAGEEPGRHGWANQLYREALQATVDNLHAQLNTYQRAESDNAAGWQGS
jgi:hypothetical protein